MTSKTKLFPGIVSLEKREYILRYLPQHLAKTGKPEQLYVLLTDIEFIKIKIDEIGFAALIEDYDLAWIHDLYCESENCFKKTDILRTVQNSLRVVSNFPKEEVFQQLVLQLTPCQESELQAFVQQIQEKLLAQELD